MSNPSPMAVELFNLGFRMAGAEGWKYLHADWGDGMTAMLECSEGGVWRCKVSAPGEGWTGRIACGKSRDPMEAVREAARLVGLAYIEAVRTLESREKSMRARLEKLAAVKEKLDNTLKKGK